MADNKSPLLEVYLQEYQRLKDEQKARIGFRDNLLYVTLGLFGGILSFSLANNNYYAFLIIPWICLILGWTYLVNDEKITALGRYIRYTLVEKVKEEAGQGEIDSIFGWEIAHRSDNRRHRRKLQQLVVDELTFVVSGIAAIVAFWLLVSQVHWGIQVLCWAELVFLIFLGIEIVIYADLAKGR
ncbi:hypothetical protein XM38_008490 [Halomicronema hongdechloris C2206]|uniref:Integral membrane protein n=1 Tax=Halomicronema hongdechloris C2206 TaxID=1641165 RepID=A0A1Z3HHX3_9CYAN|nr:hypothetical protein [Halomicronema hongdechloris]ASC69919.1 hypothetical protein XM38_008490 [Halomicronema hongdechloris C2206]